MSDDSLILDRPRGVAAPATAGRRAAPPVAASDRIVRGVAVAITAVIAAPVLALVVQLGAGGIDVWRHLIATTLPEIVANTAILMVTVGTGVAVIGVATAWLVTMCRFPGSRLFEIALLLPMAMPAFIIGYAYTDLLTFAGPVQTGLRTLFGWGRADYWFPDINTVGGVAAMLTLVLYPYVYLLARAAFLEQSSGVLEAARTLGCGAWGAFFRVALPLARPAIGAGVALALMETLADFGTVQYFGVSTFTTAIYRTWFGMGEKAVAAQLSLALLAFALTLVALERVSRGARGYQHTSRKLVRPNPTVLGGWRAAAAFAACAAPVLLGFVVPIGVFLKMTLDAGDTLILGRLAEYAGNSLLLAAIAAVVTVLVAVVLAYAARLDRGPVARIALRIASSGYAIPGSVVAVGILVPLGLFDNAVDRVMRETFGVGSGLLLSGSVVALTYAYLVRFLAVATGPVESGLGKIGASLDGTARSLGASPLKVVTRIHAPLLSTSAMTAALIVFVDVFKELPATMIVRPFNFETLAVRVYQLAADERLAQASTGALLIVAVGLVPVVLLSLSIRRGRERRIGTRG